MGRGGLALLVVVGLAVAAGVWWIAGWVSMPGDSEASERMVESIAAMPDGREVNLADVLTITWDRAVLMEPYATGSQMNEKLGFGAFRDDAWGPLDEANQLVVFVAGQSVVATANLFPDPSSFRFDQSIRDFTRDDATFVVERDGGRVTLTRP